MITLENEKIRVSISEGRGARIEEFWDKEKNKDWVWRPTNLDKTKAQDALDLNAGFDDAWAGGWEEVFPNDAPTEVMGHKLKDHGEVWRRPWALIDKHSNGRSASFSVDCESYPMGIRKRYTLDERRPWLYLEYEILSRSDKKLPYIFKFHPALAIEVNDEFRMPDSTMEPIALGFSRILGKDKKFTYPEGEDSQGRKVTIDRVLPNDGHMREFVKLSQLARGECTLINRRTQRALSFEFSKEAISYVWLFQSYGGFMDHYVAMMEPTNAGHYDLALAEKENKCGFLQPKERKTFGINIKLHDL